MSHGDRGGRGIAGGDIPDLRGIGGGLAPARFGGGGDGSGLLAGRDLGGDERGGGDKRGGGGEKSGGDERGSDVGRGGGDERGGGDGGPNVTTPALGRSASNTASSAATAAPSIKGLLGPSVTMRTTSARAVACTLEMPVLTRAAASRDTGELSAAPSSRAKVASTMVVAMSSRRRRRTCRLRVTAHTWITSGPHTRCRSASSRLVWSG